MTGKYFGQDENSDTHSLLSFRFAFQSHHIDERLDADGILFVQNGIVSKLARPSDC